MKRTPFFFALALAFGMSGSAYADKVGVTVDAAQTVREIGHGKARTILTNAEIYENDRLKADASGNAQIQLIDGTKIVVGPNADVKIDDFVYNGGPTLQKLTVSATRGAFRFISGRSDHAAYRINTPNGTIGVRGTAFDVTISREGTHVALLNGGLRVCDRSGQCREIRNPCEYILIGRRGLDQERLNSAQMRARSQKLFPLLVNQGRFRPQFQQFAAGCSAAFALPAPIFQRQAFSAVPSVTGSVSRPSDPGTTPGAPASSPGNAPSSPGNSPSSPGNTPSGPGNTPSGPGNTPSTPDTPGNPGNGKSVGNAGEQPGNGGFGNDGQKGKSGDAPGKSGNNASNGNTGNHGNSANAPGHNR